MLDQLAVLQRHDLSRYRRLGGAVGQRPTGEVDDHAHGTFDVTAADAGAIAEETVHYLAHGVTRPVGHAEAGGVAKPGRPLLWQALIGGPEGDDIAVSLIRRRRSGQHHLPLAPLTRRLAS